MELRTDEDLILHGGVLDPQPVKKVAPKPKAKDFSDLVVEEVDSDEEFEFDEDEAEEEEV